MPTGYTAKLAEGEQSFRDFVLTCARAFGACIDLRDSPLDAPIPEEFKASPHYQEAQNNAVAELDRLTAMTDDERRAYGEKQKAERVASCRKYIAKEAAQRKRYEGMVGQVQAWVPPSSEHENLKEFMLEQLQSSIKFDCSSSYWAERLTSAESADPLSLYQEAVDSAKSSVGYYEKHIEEEKKRADGNTNWVRQLRESLAQTA
jgi:hypothetical protein